MKKILLIISLVAMINSNAQKGSISGNVYYKYNNFVGNRADAGSNVVLIGDNNFREAINADLQGNYSFQNLDSGVYFLVIKSKNTNSSPRKGYELLKIYKSYIVYRYPEIKNIFSGVGYDNIEKAIKDFDDYSTSKKPKAKVMHDMRTAIMKLAFDFYEQIPAETRILTGIDMPTAKYEIHAPIVKDRLITYVTDFGITDH